MVPSREITSEASSPGAKGSEVRLDPLVVEAVADVDRSLLRWMLSLSYRDRLRAASNAGGALARILGGSA